MNSDLRLAVLGCGSIGRRHARNAAALGVRQILCFDPDSATAKAAATDVAAEVCATVDAVWAWQPHAVVIAAPTELHLPQAAAAVQHGCDVFVEKPLSHSLSGVEALCAAAERAGTITMVGCNMRFHPGPAAVREMIVAGEVGEILSSRLHTGSYLPRWRPASDYTLSYSASPEFGGAVLDCIHEIDLALWFHGPAHLIAAAVRPATSIGLVTDGMAELLLDHESGVLCSVHMNFIQRDYNRGCQIIGQRGTIRWDYMEGAVRVFGEDGVERVCVAQPQDWQVNRMYVDELRHFLECVDRRSASMNPLEHGLAALRIAAAARGNGGRPT